MEKRDIALAEIRRAIQLFRKADYVCAATLAGAAEEILGRIAKKRAGHNALDGKEAFAEGMAELFSVPTPDKAKVRAVMNRVRNECKHNDSGDNEWVEATSSTRLSASSTAPCGTGCSPTAASRRTESSRRITPTTGYRAKAGVPHRFNADCCQLPSRECPQPSTPDRLS
jgi:hypothetical protein